MVTNTAAAGNKVATKKTAWLLALVAALVSCSAENESSVRTAQQNLTEQQSRVLGFEAPTTDWSASNGSPISTSIDVTQGSHSLAVTINGYTEIISTQIAAPGSSRPQATFDIKPAQQVPWGEARLVVLMPSQGHNWRDLGGVALTGLTAGQFHTLSFTIPGDVQAALEGSATDLSFRVILNGPSGSQFIVDNLIVSEGGGSSPGDPGTVGQAFSLSVPRGSRVQDVIISGTGKVTIDDRSTISEQQAPATVSSIGPERSEFGAGVNVYGNVVSKGDVDFLRSGSLITGTLTTEGTVLQQNNVVVSGGIFTGVPVENATTEWSVNWPAGAGQNVSLPPDSPNVDLAPGHYGSVQVYSRSTITLRSGVYFIDSFFLEPQVNFKVDASAGLVQIYVRDTLVLRSGIEYVGGEEGQVLFGYLGNGPALYEEALVAAVVAPNSAIELRRPASGLPHKGSFFGKEVHVFSDATVLHIPLDLTFICPSGDFDGDEVLNCFDECWNDSEKVTPGICGCGTADTDTDGDGVADCHDECPLDPEVQIKGDCGCPSDPAPEGTLCDDGVCSGVQACGAGKCGSEDACRPSPSCSTLKYSPQTNSYFWFCDGPVSWEEAATACGTYGFGALARVNTRTLNEFVKANLSTASWLGGNARGSAGDWYWARYGNVSGQLFWSGGQAGGPDYAAFNAWPSPPADSAECVSSATSGTWAAEACSEARGFVCEVRLDRFGGGGNGGGSLVPRFPTPGDVLGIPPIPDGGDGDGDGDGDTDPCISEEDAFGNLTEEEIILLLEECTECQTDFGTEEDPYPEECDDICVGPAAPPVPGQTCPSDDEGLVFDEKASCGGVTLPPNPMTCDSTDDCMSQLSDPPVFCFFDNDECDDGEECIGMFCGVRQVCTRNYPGATETSDKLCAVPQPECDPADLDDLQEGDCEEINICSEPIEVTSIEAPGADLSETVFDPEEMFESTDVDPAVPYPTENEDYQAQNLGFGHPWCHVELTDGLEDQDPNLPQKSGDSGEGLVRFDFEPTFEFTQTAGIGAFGLPEMYANAQAGFKADVELGFAGSPSFTIIEVLAELRASQCGAYGNVVLDIFEKDFTGSFNPSFPEDEEFAGAVDLPFSIPSDYSDPVVGDVCTGPDCQPSACEAAYENFQEAGNRAKKALRDAVELIRQYDERVANPNVENFSNQLCAQVLADPPRGFPAFDCPESPEETINHFVAYYRNAVGSFGGREGAVGLMDAVARLADQVPEIQTTFPLADKREDRTTIIISSQFFIGPIPVFLEVNSSLSWSIKVDAELRITPGELVSDMLLTHSDGAADVAYAGLVGTPSAGAGLGIFAGIGFGVPGFKVQLGIAGDLKLGTVYLPAYVGTGVMIGSESDTRDPPADVVAAAFDPTNVPGGYLVPPKRYSARVKYQAGLQAKVRDILKGEIAAKLKLKVAFFRKTWRKRLLSFSGLCEAVWLDGAGNVDPEGSVLDDNDNCDFTLFHMENAPLTETGDIGWGKVRMPISFPTLRTLLPGSNAEGSVGAASEAKVDQFFYDSQCMCLPDGAVDHDPETACFRNGDCCNPESICFEHQTGDDEGGRECTGCIPEADPRGCSADQECCLIDIDPSTIAFSQYASAIAPFCTENMGCQTGLCGSPCMDDADCRSGLNPTEYGYHQDYANTFTCEGGVCQLLSDNNSNLCVIVR